MTELWYSQVFHQITCQQPEKMPCRVFPFGNAVSSVGIRHHGEMFVVLDEFIDQTLEALVMDIIVCGPMDDQEVSLQPVGVRDR